MPRPDPEGLGKPRSTSLPAAGSLRARGAAARRSRCGRSPAQADNLDGMSANRTPHQPIRHRGPMILRGDSGEATTTEQRLLDQRGPTDWVHTDPWRVLRIHSEFIEGFGALAELPPAVSIFGSARCSETSGVYRDSRRLAAMFVDAGYAVITGGGPGVMEAGNRGACDAEGLSVGLGIELPHEQGMNDWVEL